MFPLSKLYVWLNWPVEIKVLDLRAQLAWQHLYNAGFPLKFYMWNPYYLYRTAIRFLTYSFPAKSKNGTPVYTIYAECRHTCKPCNSEIPALRFPFKDPVNPYKHLQCILIWGNGMNFLKSSLDEHVIKHQNFSKDIFRNVTSPNFLSEAKTCPQL